MPGDVQDEIAQHLLTTQQGVTIAAGYDLPEDFRLVTDEVLMWDEVGGRYPAAILQIESKASEALGFSYVFEGRLSFRWIVYFQVLTVLSPDINTDTRPARYARRYLSAIERAYMQDISRGGLADWTEPDGEPTSLVWRDNGAGAVFEATAKGVCVYEFNPREA